MSFPQYKIDSRVQFLIDHFEEDLITVDAGLRPEIYQKVMAENANLSMAKRVAVSLEHFLYEKDVTVLPHDILAGQFHYYTYSETLPLLLKQARVGRNMDTKPLHSVIEEYEDNQSF